MHPTILIDRARDSERRALKAFDAAMELGVRLGGTITGDVVGVLKRRRLEKELGPTAALVHRQIRRKAGR